MADLFSLPNGQAVDENRLLVRPWSAWTSWVHDFVYAGRQAGVTADRPIKGLWIGRRYFDMTLNKPVFISAVKPTVWRDAAGVIA